MNSPKQEVILMLKRLGKNYQIALPKEVVKNLDLHVNDYLDIKVEENKIIIEPQIIIPKDQAYFYTKEWQKEEAEAQEDIRKGHVTKTEDIDGLFTELER
jgi:antitoxin MazE